MPQRIMAGILSVIIVMAAISMPVSAKTQSNPSWGGSSLGQLFRRAAVVGKVLAYSQENNSYVVFGRLSVNDGNGYKVYESRKFYRVYPKWGDTDDQLAQNVGRGLKLFGEFESATGIGNEEKLLAEKTFPYDPASDVRAGQEPAYGPNIGPQEWIGFGISKLTNKLIYFDVVKSSDVVNTLSDMHIAITSSRLFLRKAGNNKLLLYCKDSGSSSGMDARETARWLMNTSQGLQTVGKNERQAVIQRLRPIWRRLNEKWYMEKDLDVLNQMRNAVGGSAYYLGKNGGVNGYIEEAPVLRPQVDAFMQRVEAAAQGDFNEWACPTVNYGQVALSWGIDPDTGERVLKRVDLNGIYFDDGNPRHMVDALGSPSPEINMETWRLEGLKSERAKEIDGQYCWLSGQRVLVYQYTDKDGEPRLVHIYNGSLKDEPEYVLVDYYIAVNRVLTRDEYGFMLDLLRELALQGGI